MKRYNSVIFTVGLLNENIIEQCCKMIEHIVADTPYTFKGGGDKWKVFISVFNTEKRIQLKISANTKKNKFTREIKSEQHIALHATISSWWLWKFVWCRLARLIAVCFHVMIHFHGGEHAKVLCILALIIHNSNLFSFLLPVRQ